jgi:hypothetical protein
VAVLVAAVSISPTFATSIIVDFTEDRIIIAADSRAIDSQKQAPRDDYCKLTVVGNNILFASAGNTAYLPHDSSDLAPEWHAENDATRAFETASNHDLQSMGMNWATSVANHFKFLYSINPRKVEEDVARQNGGFVLGLFAGTDTSGALAVYQVSIFWDNWNKNISVLPLFLPIQARIETLSPQIYSPNATTQELITGQTERAKHATEEWKKRVRGNPKAETGVLRLEFLIDETAKFDSSVHSPINAVSISSKGVKWLRNETCK